MTATISALPRSGAAGEILGWAVPQLDRLGRDATKPSRRFPLRFMSTITSSAWVTVWGGVAGSSRIFALAMSGYLPFQDAEAVAVRSCWIAGNRFEYSAHSLPTLALKSAEFGQRAKTGAAAGQWPERTKELLLAVDELHDNNTISVDTYRKLTQWYTDRQLLEAATYYGLYSGSALMMMSGHFAPDNMPDLLGTDPNLPVDGPRRKPAPGPLADTVRPGTIAGVVEDIPGLPDPGVVLPADADLLDTVRATTPVFKVPLRLTAGLQKKLTMPPRSAHLTVLRSIWRTGPIREWEPRLALARRAGIDQVTLERVTRDDPGAPDRVGTLLRAVDEWCTDLFISDETWAKLSRQLLPRQRIEFSTLLLLYRMYANVGNVLAVREQALGDIVKS